MTTPPAGATEHRLRAAVESSPSGLLMTNDEGRIILVNHEVERLFGYPREELLGQPVEMLIPERFRGQHPGFRGGFMGQPRTRAMGAGRDLYGLRKDGTEVPVEIGLTPVITEEGVVVISSIVDISARKEAERERARLEEQLRQAQKLEAIGTLAGGIAHDFNNILGTVMGYAELLSKSVPGSAEREDLQQILGAAERGRQLVQQILTFSRRRELVRRPVRLDQVVAEAAKHLRAVVPENIALRVRVSPDVPRILADPTGLHQVLLNLGTNSAHAMPRGGEIEIVAEPLYVRDSAVRALPELHEGPYAQLVVRDTGDGMDPATRARAFEPFFTTRAPGSGTGLGLAIVHGIVRDHEGAIELESTPGQGTTCRCMFPALEGVEERVAGAETAIPQGRGERVLLVDDERSLARAQERSLADLGYRPTMETGSRRALELFHRSPADFDLMVTDYSMPEMSGLDLARAVHAIRADIPIILVTGFLDDLPPEVLEQAGVRLILRKPVSRRQMAVALRELLDG